ncbi:MAG: hypothetical protein VB091_09455 [Christensenella sp.]|nr:hypothetical protein [Christensenella sp.]
MDTQTPLWRDAEETDGAHRAANALERILLASVLIIALVFVYLSQTSTNLLDPASSSGRTIFIPVDPIGLNLAVTVVAIALFRLLRIARPPEEFVNVSAVLCLSALAIGGILWTFLVQATPSGDAAVFCSSAAELAEGKHTALSNSNSFAYFFFASAPKRLGFLLYLETLMRMLGEEGTWVFAPVINVLLLVSGYGAVLRTTRLVFDDNRVSFLTLLLLCVCVQPLLACTEINGRIPALAFALWGVYFAARFLQDGRKHEIPLFVLFSAFAVLLNASAWFLVGAVAAVLLLQALRERAAKPLIAAAILVTLCLLLPAVVQASFEARAGVSLGKGYSLSSRRAAGWNDNFDEEMYDAYGADFDRISQQSREELAQMRDTWKAAPIEAIQAYALRFSGQWNEPTFGSIQAATASESYGERALFVEQLGEGEDLYLSIVQALDYELQIVYVGLALSLLVFLRRHRVEQMIVPIALLIFVVHRMRFGGYGLDVVTALPILAPLAAHGILAFGVNTQPWFVQQNTRTK